MPKKYSRDYVKEWYAARLKEFRESKSLNQSELAKLLGTSASYISDIELKKTLPGGDLILTLKRETDIDMDWFLSDNAITEKGTLLKKHSNVSGVQEVYDWQAEEERVKNLEEEYKLLKAKNEQLEKLVVLIAQGKQYAESH